MGAVRAALIGSGERPALLADLAEGAVGAVRAHRRFALVREDQHGPVVVVVVVVHR